MNIKNIVFDFGGVLIDWNPRRVYKKYFSDEKAMEHFLKNICSSEWNLEQDKGRSFAEGTAWLLEKFPEHSKMISVFYDEWADMLGESFDGTVALMRKLKENYRLFGLTNWAAESIHVAYERYPFINEFEGVVVSGIEKIAKPDVEIFNILLRRYDLRADESIFIDDNIKNVEAASALGFHAVHFENSKQAQCDVFKILNT